MFVCFYGLMVVGGAIEVTGALVGMTPVASRTMMTMTTTMRTTTTRTTISLAFFHQ